MFGQRRTLYAFVILGILSFLILVAAAPNPSKEVVYIYPGRMEHTISSGQVGVLRWGFTGCTKGLTNDQIAASTQHYELYKDGELVQTITNEEISKFFGDLELYKGEINGEPARETCFWPAREVYISRVVYKKLKLNQSGIYLMNVYLGFTEPTIDGFDFDGDGVPEYYEGAIWDHTIEITVE